MNLYTVTNTARRGVMVAASSEDEAAAVALAIKLVRKTKNARVWQLPDISYATGLTEIAEGDIVGVCSIEEGPPPRWVVSTPVTIGTGN